MRHPLSASDMLLHYFIIPAATHEQDLLLLLQPYVVLMPAAATLVLFICMCMSQPQFENPTLGTKIGAREISRTERSKTRHRMTVACTRRRHGWCVGTVCNKTRCTWRVVLSYYMEKPYESQQPFLCIRRFYLKPFLCTRRFL